VIVDVPTHTMPALGPETLYVVPETATTTTSVLPCARSDEGPMHKHKASASNKAGSAVMPMPENLAGLIDILAFILDFGVGFENIGQILYTH
jgi:hypothetical protein